MANVVEKRRQTRYVFFFLLLSFLCSALATNGMKGRELGSSGGGGGGGGGGRGGGGGGGGRGGTPSYGTGGRRGTPSYGTPTDGGRGGTPSYGTPSDGGRGGTRSYLHTPYSSDGCVSTMVASGYNLVLTTLVFLCVVLGMSKVA